MANVDQLIPNPNAKKYFYGDRMGNCFFIKEISKRKYGRRTAIFKCDCGKEFESTITGVLNDGRRCGCTKFKHLPKGIPIKHGHASRNGKTPEYKVWCGMKSRCNNIKNKRFKDYGGRGIKVCERWNTSFENFYLDMGHRPSANHTLERKSVHGDYEPANCIWLLRELQSKNKRSNRIIEFNGSSRLLSEWSLISGIGRLTIHRRLKAGWSIEDALTVKPLNKPYKKYQN